MLHRLVQSVESLGFLLDDLLLLDVEVLQGHFTLLLLFHKLVNIVEHLNVHLERVHDVEVNLAKFDVTRKVGDGALSTKDLRKVVVLHRSQRGSVILSAPTHKIMEIVGNLEDPPVHNHQLKLSHVLVLKPSLEIRRVVKLREQLDSSILLLSRHVVKTLLVLKLKCLLILQQQVWQC